MICFSIFVVELREINSEDKPKSPESKGRRGCLTGRLNVNNPRSPASENTIKLTIVFSSLKIK